MPKILRNKTYDELMEALVISRARENAIEEMYKTANDCFSRAIEMAGQMQQEMILNFREQFGDEINKLHKTGIIGVWKC